MGRFLLGVVVTLLVLAGAAYAVITTGSYDVAATTPDSAPVAWAATTTRYNAIKNASAAIAAPATFTDAQVKQGRAIYSRSCVFCHGGPGADPAPFAAGMNPEPPYMPDLAGMVGPSYIFWTVQHGIKMTGMPSYGKVLNDEQIWSVAAFVKKMEGMTPEQYKALGE